MADKVKVYGKAQNRTALGIVHAYLRLHPETTLEQLRAAFPGEINAAYNGRFKHIFYSVKDTRYDNGQRAGELLDAKQLDSEFFDEPDEIIHLTDGTDVYFVQTWAKADFERMIEKGKEYDITVAEFEKADGNFARGNFRLEYINGYVPPVSQFIVADNESNANEPEETYPDYSSLMTPADEERLGGRKGCCRWLWLLLLLLLLLLIAFLLMKGCKGVDDKSWCDCTGKALPAMTTTSNDKALEAARLAELQKAREDSIARAEADSASLATEKQRIEAQEAMDALQTKFNNLQFSVGSAEMNSKSKAILGEVAELLKKYPDLKVKVVGHASKDGSDEANQRVSEKRAEAAKAELVRQGIEAERILTEGRGSREPISETNQPLNRRTEFEVIK